MQFSEENSIAERFYAVFRRKQHTGMILCGFQKKTAYRIYPCCFEEETACWNDFMRFPEENSIPYISMLF